MLLLLLLSMTVYNQSSMNLVEADKWLRGTHHKVSSRMNSRAGATSEIVGVHAYDHSHVGAC